MRLYQTRKHSLQQSQYMKTTFIKIYPIKLPQHSNYSFLLKFYLQIKGYAMSKVYTPAYANNFMTDFEKNYIYVLIKDKLALFLVLYS